MCVYATQDPSFSPVSVQIHLRVRVRACMNMTVYPTSYQQSDHSYPFLELQVPLLFNRIFLISLHCTEFGITVNDWEWNLDTELNPQQLTKFFAYL